MILRLELPHFGFWAPNKDYAFRVKSVTWYLFRRLRTAQDECFDDLISRLRITQLCFRDDLISRLRITRWRAWELRAKCPLVTESTLKESSVSVVLRVVKSWCNGWATSYRYHDDKLLPCLFGCRCQGDDMKHYHQCPHLFAIVKFMHPDTSADPLVRWGLVSPSSKHHKLVACTFTGYHAVRRMFRNSSSFLNTIKTS